MRSAILIFGVFCLPGKESMGQYTNKFLFDEFSVSVNRTNVQDDNTEDIFGFGLGVYRGFMADKMLNVMVGLEFNRTSQFKKFMYESHSSHSAEVTYSLNCISIPVGLRVNVGSKTKFFIEAGGFGDLAISSNRSGTLHGPDVFTPPKDFDKKAGLSPTVGIYFGMGMRIPISRFELVVKPEYKLGLTKLYSGYDDIYNRYFRLSFGLKFI